MARINSFFSWKTLSKDSGSSMSHSPLYQNILAPNLSNPNPPTSSHHGSLLSISLPSLLHPQYAPLLNVLSLEYEYRGMQKVKGSETKHDERSEIPHDDAPTNPFFKSPLHSPAMNAIQIKSLLLQLSSLDSSSLAHSIGRIGEREARVYSELVAERHYYMAHGIGRSGDLFAIQPKALGSSILYALAKRMMVQMIRLSMVGGMSGKKGKRESPPKNPCEDVLLLPMATGMSIVLTMRALIWRERFHLSNSEWHQRRYVLWPRIDQKTCFKSILSAGFEPVIVENILDGDQLRTNLEQLEKHMIELGADKIVCVLSTTSCFAPRTPDRVREIAVLCQKYNIPHVINNAYGVQSDSIMNQIAQATYDGRVDAFVQSTDKNFLVPVGGAVVASHDKAFIKMLSETYAGRASISPILDIFITCAQSDADTWKQLWRERKRIMKDYLMPKLRALCEKHGERVLSVRNPVSLAISLNNLDVENPTLLGSKLFYKGITGARVVSRSTQKSIVQWKFSGYGSHCNEYPCNYLVFACAIGVTESDIDTFLKALDACLRKMKKST